MAGELACFSFFCSTVSNLVAVLFFLTTSTPLPRAPSISKLVIGDNHTLIYPSWKKNCCISPQTTTHTLLPSIPYLRCDRLSTRTSHHAPLRPHTKQAGDLPPRIALHQEPQPALHLRIRRHLRRRRVRLRQLQQHRIINQLAVYRQHHQHQQHQWLHEPQPLRPTVCRAE